MNCFKYTSNCHLSDRLKIGNIKNFEFIEVCNNRDNGDGGNSENVKLKTTRF